MILGLVRLMAIVLTLHVIVNAQQRSPDTISIDGLVIDGSENKPTLLSRLKEAFIVLDFTPTSDVDISVGHSTYLIWQRHPDDPSDADAFNKESGRRRLPQRRPIAQISFSKDILTDVSRYWYVESPLTFDGLFFQLLEKVSRGRNCRIQFKKNDRPEANITCGRVGLWVLESEIVEFLVRE